MKSNLDNYLLELTDNLAFLTVDETALQGFGEMPKDFAIPVFVEDIKKMGLNGEGDGFSTKQIAAATIYLLGIDKDFKYNEAYREFLNKAIDRPEAFAMELGMDKYDLRSYKDALVFLRGAMTLKEQEKYPIFNFGQIALEFSRNTKNPALAQDLMEAAEKAFEKVLEIDEKEALANFQLGLILLEKGDGKQSKKHLQVAFENGDQEIKDKAKTLLNEVTASDMLEKAEKYIDELNFSKAVQTLEDVDTKDLMLELRFQIYFVKGFSYKALGQIEDAVGAYEQALAINNQDTLLLAELGICYAYLGDFEQSLEFYMSALEIEKDSVEILNNIAIVYLNMNNVAKAKEFIGYAKALSQDDEIVDATIGEIRKYEEKHK